ncbi:MAG: hypothetical protein E7641_00435 [Ruminococcaceae bacterium]|nr:hypothetical protein [Oscillospiraceae bacterium]
MLFGIAKRNITPPFKMKLACTGNGADDFEDIHDDIYTRCLVIDDGKMRSLIISYDLLFHDRTLNDAIAEYAKREYGIAPEAVCVTYTHAHTAPAAKGYNPNHHNDDYEELLINRGKECIDAAIASVFEGYLEYGRDLIDLNISRRGYVNGAYVNAPNFNYEHDRELFIICIKDNTSTIRAVLVNYACHPVFYPALLTLSGEFPARLCEIIETEYKDAMAIFLQSAAGDVRPAATVGKADDGRIKWMHMSFSDIENFSNDLFAAVEKVLKSGNMKKSNISLSSDLFVVDLPIDGCSLEEIENRWEKLKKIPDRADRTHTELIVNGGYDSLPDSMKLFCQTIRLGDDLYIAAVGGEPCYGIKLALKKVFEGYDLCFVGYTDASAYIVDDKILSEGGYEATCHLEYGLKGPFKEGITKRISDAFEISLESISSKK